MVKQKCVCVHSECVCHNHITAVTMAELVDWCLTSLYTTNMAISKKSQGWKAIPTQ